MFLYVVKSDRDISPDHAGTAICFDGDSGRFGGLLLPTGENLGLTLSMWLFALHMAKVWGLPFQIFVCTMGLMVAMLSVTGVYIQLKKPSSASLKRQLQTARSADNRADNRGWAFGFRLGVLNHPLQERAATTVIALQSLPLRRGDLDGDPRFVSRQGNRPPDWRPPLFLPGANFSANVARNCQNIRYGGAAAIGLGGRSEFMTVA